MSLNISIGILGSQYQGQGHKAVNGDVTWKWFTKGQTDREINRKREANRLSDLKHAPILTLGTLTPTYLADVL